MENKLLERAKAFLKAHHNQNIWYRIMCVLASLVVFVTTYMLILPAITMEKETYCGLEEHIHTEDCYQIQENTPGKVLDCTYGTLQVHQHTDSCYDENNHLICDQATYILHAHDANCYNEGGVLVCTLPEIKAHQHTDSCYLSEQVLVCGQQETAGHTHDSGCYTKERGSLICAAKEHAHSESCYDENGNLVCGLQEHQHQDECYQWTEVLTCGQTEQAAHTHSAGCYETRKTLICGYDKLKVSSHQHTAACFREGTADDTKILVCGMTEHQHSEVCYQENAADLLLEQEAQNAGLVDEDGLIEDMDSDVPLQADGSLPEAGRAYGVSAAALAGESEKETTVETGLSTEDVDETEAETEVETEKETEISTETEIINETEAEQVTETEIQPEIESESEMASEEATEQETENSAALTSDTEMDEEETETEAFTEEMDLGVMLFETGEESVALLASGNQADLGQYITAITGTGTTYDKTNDSYETNLKIEFSLTKTDITNANREFTYKYPEGVLVPEGLLNTQKSFTDEGGNYAGTYLFVKNEDGTYSVQLTFDQSYMNNTAGDTVKGFVSFYGFLSSSKVDENGNIVLTGSDKLEINIPSDKITYPKDETNLYHIDVSKNGSYVTDGKKLVYTVYVNSLKGTPDPIAFEDTITASGLVLGTPSVEVQKGDYHYFSQYTNYYGDTWTDVNVTPNYADGKITMSLPKLAGGITVTENNGEHIKADCYKIIYTYDLSSAGDVVTSVNNEVKVSAEDKTKGQIVSDEASATVNINTVKTHTMVKSGQYDANNGKINWTITINENGANIAGALLTDDMLGMIPSGTSITVSPSDGYILSMSDGKVTGIQFNSIGETSVNTNKYTITYSTEASGGWDDVLVTNHALFDPTPSDSNSGDEISQSPTVTVSGGKVEKSMSGAVVSDDRTSAEITWTVTITVPESGLPAGTVIEDNVTKNQYGTENTNQWMTWQQIVDWNKSLKWENGSAVDFSASGVDVVFMASDGQTYSYDTIVQNEENTMAELKYTVMKITLSNALGRPDNASKLILTYCTTADLTKASVGINKYYNSVNVGGKTAGAEYSFQKAGVVKFDGNWQAGTSNTSSEGDVSWIVKVTTDDQNHKSLTIKDTLPEGVLLDSIDVNGWTVISLTIGQGGNITGSNSQFTVSGTYESATGKIELVMTPLAEDGVLQYNAEYSFKFKCHVDTENNSYVPGTAYPFTNNVTAETDLGTIGSSNQTQNWTYTKTVEETKVVDKSGTWDNDSRRLSYSVLINPEGKDLVEGTDTLTLTDTVSYWRTRTAYNSGNGMDILFEVSLLQNSVKLYHAVKNADDTWSKGTPVTDWSWTYSSVEDQYTPNWMKNTLTVTGVPDSSPLIFEYNYMLYSSAARGYEFNLDVQNTIKLEGTSYSDTENGQGNTWKDQQSSAGITTDKAFTLYKVEAGNYGTNLEGAVFSVYRYDTGTSAYVSQPITTYTTDAQGKFQIQWQDGSEVFAYNTLYKVVETSAPAGYLLPDSPTEYYFYFSSETDTSNTLPSGDAMPARAVDLSKTSHTVYAENVKNETEIKVEKKWKDTDNNEIEQSSGSVEVNLYRKESNGSSSGSGSTSGNVSLSFNVTSQNGNWWTETVNVASGSTVTFSVTNQYGGTSQNYNYISITGAECQPVRTQNGNEITDTYTFVVTQDITVGGSINWNSTDISHTGPTITPPASTENGTGESGSTDVLMKTVTISASDNWQHIFTGLPLVGTDAEGNTVYYTYYVQEVSVTGYTTSYDNNGGIQSGTITIVNKKDDSPRVSITVAKDWVESGVAFSGTHDAITVELYKKGENEANDTKIGEAELNADNGWRYEGWNDLESGNIYYVKEVNPPGGYTTSYSYNGQQYSSYRDVSAEGGSTITVTNTRQIKDISVEKRWKLPTETGDVFLTDEELQKYISVDTQVSFRLYRSTTAPTDAIDANGILKPEIQVAENLVDTVSVSKTNQWRYDWTSLPTSDLTGNTYYYYVSEDTSDHCVSIANNGGSGSDGTITVVNAVPTTSVTVNKKWFAGETDITDETSAESHPDSVTVILYQESNGDFVQYGDPVTLNKDTTPETWSYTWEDLPEGNYYVIETPITGFLTQYQTGEGEGLVKATDGSQVVITGGTVTIMNTKETTEFEVEKIWKDSSGNTLTEKMPEEIQVELYRKIKGSESGGETEETEPSEPTTEPETETGEKTEIITIRMIGWEDENGITASPPDSYWWISMRLHGVYSDTKETYDEQWPSINDSVLSNDITVVTETADGRQIEYSVEFNNCGSGSGKLLRARVASFSDNVASVIGVLESDSTETSESSPSEESNNQLTIQFAGWKDISGNIVDNIPGWYGFGLKVYYCQKGEEKWNDLYSGELNQSTAYPLIIELPTQDELDYKFEKYWCNAGNWNPSADLTFTDISASVLDNVVTIYGIVTPNGSEQSVSLEVLSETKTTSGEGETLPEPTASISESERYGDAVTLKPDTDGKWRYKWSNLPKYDADGNEYEYYVREIVPDGYTASYEDTGTKTTITNTKGGTTSITVQKVWKTYSGDTTTKSSGDALSIDLIRIATPEAEGSATETVVQTLSMPAPYQQIIVSDLPIFGTGSDGTRYNYTYKVQEGSVDGYQVSYENNNGIVSGTITINNQSTTDEGYVLPETGGSGTWPYTVGGLLLSAMACLLLYIKNKRRKELPV